MIRYLLDTNIVSFLSRGQFPAIDHHVRTLPSDSLAVSVITEAELRFGLALLPPEAKFHAVVERSLSKLQIEPWDSGCAQQYATLSARQRKAGRSLTDFDTMIAAHALAHSFILVSNDAAFRQIKGLKLEDWTKGPQRT